MRQCECCGKPDEPFYDYRQKCTCDSRDHYHGLDKHQADCFRVRHSITPYLTQLRRVKKTDQFNDSLLIPARVDEFERLRSNGFRIKAINGSLYADRLLCAPCVQQWVEREEHRQDFERAKRGTRPQTYYEMICQGN